MLQIIEVTDSEGRIVASRWLGPAEHVHRQLRPQLMPNYSDQMLRVFAGGGRMLVAVDDGQVLGLCVWRYLEKTFSRSELYIDDLVADAGHRSAGVGKALLAWCACALPLAGGEHRAALAHAFDVGSVLLFAIDLNLRRG